MVSTTTRSPARDHGGADLQAWLASLPEHVEPAGAERLRQAGELAAAALQQEGQVGEDWATLSNPYLTGLDIVHILAELHLGEDSLVAGMLYRVVSEGRLSLERVEAAFGEAVARLIK